MRRLWLTHDDDRGRRLFDAAEAATVFGDGKAGILDLARAGFATQLGYHFIDLREAGRTDRMAARQQAAGDVDRNFAAERGGAGFGHRPAFAEGAKAERFGLLDLG